MCPCIYTHIEVNIKDPVGTAQHSGELYCSQEVFFESWVGDEGGSDSRKQKVVTGIRTG